MEFSTAYHSFYAVFYNFMQIFFMRSQRHLFDIPDDIAYFNCAYYSPQLNETRKRLTEGAMSKSHPWERTARDFFSDAELIRSLAGEIFGGDADGYAVIPSASYGLSTAARAVEPQLGKGDSILILEEGFPSNVLPWKRVAAEKGAMLITVSVPEDGNWTRAIIDKIDKSVKVLALHTCHWTNGSHIDLASIRQAIGTSDIIMAVDATQSLGAVPFPLEQVRPDFLIAAGYKWLLCPYGFTLMYVSPGWRDSRPLEESWQARENAEDFGSLVNSSTRYMPGARRFDVGQKGTPTILPGAIAALEQIKSWGVDHISDSLILINNMIADHLSGLGFQIPDLTQRSPHMLGATLPEKYKGNLVAELSQRKIFISQRGNSVRFSPHLHITDNDLDRLLQTLGELFR
jgi:selenocysteine lyase/cysteine desulfurase